MKLPPYDKNQLATGRSYGIGKNQEILEEFLNSGLECAKVENWTQAQAYSAANSLNKSIQRFNFFSIKAISQNGEVFLIKKDK